MFSLCVLIVLFITSTAHAFNPNLQHVFDIELGNYRDKLKEVTLRCTVIFDSSALNSVDLHHVKDKSIIIFDHTSTLSYRNFFLDTKCVIVVLHEPDIKELIAFQRLVWQKRHKSIIIATQNLTERLSELKSALRMKTTIVGEFSNESVKLCPPAKGTGRDDVHDCDPLKVSAIV